MLGLFGFLHVFTLRLAQRRPKRRLKRQSSWPSRRRRRPASVTGGVVVVVVAVVAAVVVTAGFAAAVAFDVASIPALQEPRGLNAWERRWRNQRKKAAAKVGRSNTGRGVAASAAVYHDTGGKVPPAACENCDGSCAHLRPPWVS